MTRILTLTFAAAVLCLSSCESMKKKDSCCSDGHAKKGDSCCTDSHAEKGKTHKH